MVHVVPPAQGPSSDPPSAVLFARMERGRVVIRTDEIDAVVLDMDGLMTDTASVHARAWAGMFDRFLRRRADATGGSFSPFTDEDYRRYVDPTREGPPRCDGGHGGHRPACLHGTRRARRLPVVRSRPSHAAHAPRRGAALPGASDPGPGHAGAVPLATRPGTAGPVRVGFRDLVVEMRPGAELAWPLDPTNP